MHSISMIHAGAHMRDWHHRLRCINKASTSESARPKRGAYAPAHSLLSTKSARRCTSAKKRRQAKDHVDAARHHGRRQPARPAAKSRKPQDVRTHHERHDQQNETVDGHAPRPQLALLSHVFLRQRQKYRASADGVHQRKERVHDKQDALGRFQKKWSPEYTRIAARLCGLMRVFLRRSPSQS
jgi:hypothetical protein